MPKPHWSQLLAPLEANHQQALEWFLDREGTEVPWPEPIAPGVFLASKAKGIFKPRWSRYALSVRQTLEGPYPDRPVEYNLDGSWTYRYFQERLDLTARDEQFTNRGLLECQRDVVPVAVMIQTRGRPQVRYRILGLALVAGWEEGYFLLQSIGGGLNAHAWSPPQQPPTALAQPASRADLASGLYDFSLLEDARRRTNAIIVARQGQAAFRQQLIEAYGGRCALTGYDALDALEAAHIVPYRGPVTNHPTNGLLLRADIHTLFDLGLLAINEQTLAPVLSPELGSTSYAALLRTSKSLTVPRAAYAQPSSLALKQHREWAGL